MTMTDDEQGATEYYFNTSTQMVEKGRQSSWEHLMGPYGTHEEATKAMETAAKRSKAWDADDKAWGGDED